MRNCKILIVEDDLLFAEHLKIHLLQHGYEVVGIISSAEDALAQFEVLTPQLVLMDIVLKGAMDGIDAAQRIREQYGIPVLYLTAYSDEDFISRAKVTEPFAYILKPFNERELQLTIEMALYKHSLERELIESHNHLDEAQRIGHMGSWDWGITHNRLSWSKEIYRIFGIDETEFGASYDAFITAVHPEDRQLVNDAVNAAVHEGQPYEIDHRIVQPDGTTRIVHEQGEVQYDDQGLAVRMIGTVQDVTATRQVEEALRIYATIFENASEGMVVTDANNKIIMVNNAYCSLTGYDRDELIGRNPSVAQSGHHEQTFYQTMWDSLEKSGSWQGEIWDKRKNGEVYPKWLGITVLKDGQGNPRHHVAIFTDISELKQKEQHLHQLAYYDSLTGLANRSQFNQRLKQEFALTLRNQQQFAVLYIDLDRFKQVNDYYGHAIGDELLRQAATRMQQHLRESDILARMGGDEFTAILPTIGPPDNAAHVARKIIEALSRSFQIEDHEIEIGASIGISLYPRDGDSPDNVVLNADRAMYLSKESGGGQFNFSNEELTSEVDRRLFLDKSLRHALDREQFTLYYQPQFDIATNQLIGMEALIRWSHPQAGVISPVEFIPRAEATQLIIPIGNWVLQSACRQNRQWQEAGLPAVPVAVNFSAAQCNQSGVIDTIKQTLVATGLAPEYLDVEITESMSMKSPETTIKTLEQLTSLGIRSSIDDFGTGYSSLAYLKRFPVDKLKIDRSFVLDITTDPNDLSIATAIIGLAKSMDIKVVAEGVETVEQLEILKQLGCDYVQGYYTGRPLPAAEIQVLLERHREIQGMPIHS